MSPLSVSLATPVTTLVLIGGGEFSFGDTREIDEFLLSKMPTERRTIAFVPTASGSAEYATHLGEYFRKLAPGVDVRNVPIYRGRDSRRQKNLDALLEAGMIYVGGGVASNLLETIRESPADLAMRDAAANGAVIAAIGAAAACFGAATRGGPGLGWLLGTAVQTGFDPQQDTELRRLMSMPEVTLGLGIPAKTALAVVADGATEIIGSGQVAAFRKG